MQTDQQTDPESRIFTHSTDNPKTKSEVYLEKHRIISLFKEFIAGMIVEQPADPIGYMIKKIDRMPKSSSPLSSD
ncbi:hypothetical protein AAHC03_09713 [Spirometra sp. Aus1]